MKNPKPKEMTMTQPNESDPLSYQVGGDHYSQYEYQPIQFFNEIPLDFNRANAIKYLARWKKKNGVEDLKKAVQYLRFTETKGEELFDKILRFVRQFEDPERRIILSILTDNIREAREEIQELIEIEEAKAQADGGDDADA